MVEVFRNVTAKFDGAYNLVFLNALGEMVVLRDPLGIRPLCYAKDGALFAAASESVALVNMGFRSESIRSLLPGQMAIVGPDRFELHNFARSSRRAHCFFEWIYFANMASTLDERNVYLARQRLGRRTGAAGNRAAGRTHDRGARARNEQSRRRRDGLPPAGAGGRGLDP